MNRRPARRTAAFTLIELIVAVIMLGVLVTIADLSYSRYLADANDTATRQNLTTVAHTVLPDAVTADAFDRGRLLTAVTAQGKVLTDGAAAGPGDVSYSLTSDAGTLGLASKSTTGTCVLLRTGLGDPQTWTAALDAGCSGATALNGPGATPVTDPAHPDAPTNLTGQRQDSQISLSWIAPAPAPADYLLRRDGIPIQTVPATDTTAVVTSLRNGTVYHFTVTARSASGVESPPAEIDIDPRPAGVWDAALRWSYDGNTVCYGGASSWRYEFLAAVPAGTENRYRLQIRYANAASPGVPAYDGPLLSAVQPGLAGAVDTNANQVCAPAGNPNPPFLDVKLIVDATGADVTLGRTGQVSLAGTQLQQAPTGSAPGRPDGITP